MRPIRAIGPTRSSTALSPDQRRRKHERLGNRCLPPPLWSSTANPGRWTPLAVLATIVGAVSFPTVPPDLLLALPDDSLEPTVGAVIRGLIARRVLRPHDGAGRPLFEGIVRDQIDAAVAAELTLLLERFDSSGADVWWFGVGVDQTVQIRARRDGSSGQMGLVATAVVVAQIRRLGPPGGLGRMVLARRTTDRSPLPRSSPQIQMCTRSVDSRRRGARAT